MHPVIVAMEHVVGDVTLGKKIEKKRKRKNAVSWKSVEFLDN